MASNIRSLVSDSRWIQSTQDWKLDEKLPSSSSTASLSALLGGPALKETPTGAIDVSGEGRARLKQDRYPIRTAAQWLGPVVETWVESVRRVTVELNSANDNPLIDHRNEEVVHCGNFQGIAITVAMDQVRYLCHWLIGGKWCQWPTGSVLYSLPRGDGFETRRRHVSHCVIPASMESTHDCSI